MRAREMHPLCCIALDCPGAGGDRSPETPQVGSDGNAGGGAADVGVAGLLYKWTNYGKGWRSRWFSLRNGVLSYSKIRGREGPPPPVPADVRLIGDASARFSRADPAGRQPQKPVGVVYLKVRRSQPQKTTKFINKIRFFFFFLPFSPFFIQRKKGIESHQIRIRSLFGGLEYFSKCGSD